MLGATFRCGKVSTVQHVAKTLSTLSIKKKNLRPDKNTEPFQPEFWSFLLKHRLIEHITENNPLAPTVVSPLSLLHAVVETFRAEFQQRGSLRSVARALQ